MRWLDKRLGDPNQTSWLVEIPPAKFFSYKKPINTHAPTSVVEVLRCKFPYPYIFPYPLLITNLSFEVDVIEDRARRRVQSDWRQVLIGFARNEHDVWYNFLATSFRCRHAEKRKMRSHSTIRLPSTHPPIVHIYSEFFKSWITHPKVGKAWFVSSLFFWWQPRL